MPNKKLITLTEVAKKISIRYGKLINIAKEIGLITTEYCYLCRKGPGKTQHRYYYEGELFYDLNATRKDLETNQRFAVQQVSPKFLEIIYEYLHKEIN
ncbi:hypothetical protein ABM000_06955 [Morganella morganii]|uniref:Uncharacterized protein n=1 Tax=bacterium 19GA11TI05 TaxID=2920688 RepID=A0AAU6TRT0_UNCXX|nr:hypothetical protein [Morganella morganii]ATF52845.1 hypothetical protein CO693_03570 [Morganella morganii]EKW8499704.1 hypothetical protein [Morganella morganii]ELA7727801.1 hypothetical protein [Morganella morganii]MBT0343954.1 hypothetical protein [Morganella morganii subsp. morganii]MBT0410844.1 hypothetical protein [Morganella morganii subsp. morganii]